MSPFDSFPSNVTDIWVYSTGSKQMRTGTWRWNLNAVTKRSGRVTHRSPLWLEELSLHSRWDRDDGDESWCLGQICFTPKLGLEPPSPSPTLASPPLTVSHQRLALVLSQFFAPQLNKLQRGTLLSELRYAWLCWKMQRCQQRTIAPSLCIACLVEMKAHGEPVETVGQVSQISVMQIFTKRDGQGWFIKQLNLRSFYSG